MRSKSSKIIRQPGLWVVLAFALALAACGGKEEPPAPAQVSQPAEPAPAPAVEKVDDEEADEAVLVQPSRIDTLSVDELLEEAEKAFDEKHLFVPAGESAFEMYLTVIEQEPLHVRAKNALSDLFPYAILYVEQRTAAGDLAESERVLDMMERANDKAPALPRLKRSVEELRERIAADAKREADRAVAAAAAEERAAEEARQAAAAAASAEAEEAARREREAAEAERRAEQLAETSQPRPTPAPAPSIPEPAPAPAPAPPPPPAEPATPAAPKVISAVQPRYPPIALRRRVEGSVEVGFTIMPDGSVSNARVLSSRPSNTFDRESINAIERWRFTPPGREVESRRVFDFKLSD